MLQALQQQPSAVCHRREQAGREASHPSLGEVGGEARSLCWASLGPRHADRAKGYNAPVCHNAPAQRPRSQGWSTHLTASAHVRQAEHSHAGGDGVSPPTPHLNPGGSRQEGYISSQAPSFHTKQALDEHAPCAPQSNPTYTSSAPSPLPAGAVRSSPFSTRSKERQR